MNLLNSPNPILGTTVSLHSFKLKAINKDNHKHNYIHNSCIMMHKRVNSEAPNKLSTTTELDEHLLEPITKPCLCGRRHFIEGAATATLTTTQFPIQPATATNSDSDYTVARYKSQIFSNLKEKKANKILEIGIGTGPNLSYYGSNPDVQVVGIDPNPEMEKYARSSAASAGLPLSNFEFIHAVGEVIPLSDNSVDAVVGTLVLCSVKDVDMTLKEVRRVLRPGGVYLFVEHVAAKDGTFLRLLQRILDPLQQTLADGCHLSRDTGDSITRAGFSSVELDIAFLSNASFINPHVYGIAYQ
ncbi:unnamed protein product [Trifolium pratense]|uniref:Uncharacterized protein n=1 Tax=Trifolium pratense TaxID=57577 RepID=A0ACB0JVZ5_TRIPR|nr:unnamed protein product [Trifolium pratense]